MTGFADRAAIKKLIAERHGLDVARDARKLAELALRASARRLMRVNGEGYDVPTDWKQLLAAARLGGASGMLAGRPVNRWDIMHEFAVKGAPIRRIAAWWRIEPDRVADMIRFDLETLAVLRRILAPKEEP